MKKVFTKYNYRLGVFFLSLGGIDYIIEIGLYWLFSLVGIILIILSNRKFLVKVVTIILVPLIFILLSFMFILVNGLPPQD